MANQTIELRRGEYMIRGDIRVRTAQQGQYKTQHNTAENIEDTHDTARRRYNNCYNTPETAPSKWLQTRQSPSTPVGAKRRDCAELSDSKAYTFTEVHCMAIMSIHDGNCNRRRGAPARAARAPALRKHEKNS